MNNSKVHTSNILGVRSIFRGILLFILLIAILKTIIPLLPSLWDFIPKWLLRNSSLNDNELPIMTPPEFDPEDIHSFDKFRIASFIILLTVLIVPFWR